MVENSNNNKNKTERRNKIGYEVNKSRIATINLFIYATSIYARVSLLLSFVVTSTGKGYSYLNREEIERFQSDFWSLNYTRQHA